MVFQLGSKPLYFTLNFMKSNSGATHRKKKMIILHKGTEEHRDAGTSAPQGEPGTPPSVFTPQSPCTATRAVGVGTLYRDTIYAATAIDKRDCTGFTLTHIAGGSSLPPAQGIFPKAACARGGSHACTGLFGGCSSLLQLVWVRVGLCGPCSPRQGRAPLCPHKPTRTRGGQ